MLIEDFFKMYFWKGMGSFFKFEVKFLIFKDF